jgi:hypothetical protein
LHPLFPQLPPAQSVNCCGDNVTFILRFIKIDASRAAADANAQQSLFEIIIISSLIL